MLISVGECAIMRITNHHGEGSDVKSLHQVSLVAAVLSVAANGVELVAPGVASPAAVRYLHCAPFTGNIFNEMNLPLGVFRADR